MLNGWLRELWQRPVEERVPVAVLVDTAELEQCLGALANPTHTAVVEAEPDEMLHGAFDGAGADLEIEVDEPLVVHHGEALGEVLDGLLKPSPAGTGMISSHRFARAPKPSTASLMMRAHGTYPRSEEHTSEPSHERLSRMPSSA